MAYTNFIPKIEWLKGTLSGTTAIGSDTITGIADTGDVQVGMFFEGAGIPANALVVSKTASTVVIDKDATAAATVTLSFGFRIEFDYPPLKDPFGENDKFFGSTLKSKSGQTQSIEDHIEINLNITLSHLSQTLKDSLQNFYRTHALKNKSFSYFTDKGEPTSEEVYKLTEAGKNVKYKVINRKRGGFDFAWSVPLKARRVL